MNQKYFHSDISRHIWETKYRFHNGDVIHDQTIEDTWWRIAKSLADAENNERGYWAQKFFDELKGFRFIPGGRIQAGAGTGHQVTLLNCFVMGTIQDSMESIFDNLKEGALTMQQGGGVGYDFSTLRPNGSLAKLLAPSLQDPFHLCAYGTVCAQHYFLLEHDAAQ